LTYLAQVRQVPCKNVWLYRPYASTTPRILHIKPNKKHGISRKETAIIGIAPVVGWVGQNPSMGEWSMDVVYWQTTYRFISSPSHAEERR
jgi:hypothetical protein